MLLRRLISAGLCLALAGPAVVYAQDAMGGDKPASSAAKASPSESLNGLLIIMESQVVGAAAAMPADKYDFAPPTKFGLYTGVRTYAQQVKHLTEANYAFFRGWGVEGAVDRKTIEALTTKEEMVDALKKSYAYAHRAMDTITPDNAFDEVHSPEGGQMTRVAIAAFCMAHSMDHYGQMVEYLRMNGIVPPASQPRKR